MASEYIEYQREMAALAPQPMLNCGCKEDPAKLGRDFGATNLDIQDYDPQTRTNLYTVPNFVCGSVLTLTEVFPKQYFGSVVLGDVLEHATFDLARRALDQCKAVLRPDGWLIITMPMDRRPKEMNHAPEHLVEYPGGFVSWHLYWPEEQIEKLLEDSGFVCDFLRRKKLRYPGLDWQTPCFGLGIVANPSPSVEHGWE
jgi:SAM-dependent methyltransferase